MRQIGVREEAAVVGGYGHCGQELCCQRFGLSFEPVSIRMAKEQDLPLHSTKISGACGRLMCCLRYEFEAYRDFKGRAPKRNAVIDTPLGKGKIVEYDTPKEQICLRLENGKQIRVPLADMTASEAATKKSQELGCACRPDTVTRDVLDHLQSADVQMALAELDRRMGVVPAEAVDQSDIFVEPKRRRRRGGSQEGQGTGVPTATTATDETDGSATPSRRRRHKSRGARGAQGEGAVAEPQATEQADPATRAEEAPRRRRHHRAADTDGGAHEVTDQDTQPAAKRTVKRTRHPGDRGGAVSRQQPGGQQSRNQASQAQQQGEGEAKPKRRRHRGSRGGGNAGGSEAGGGAPSAE